MFLGNVGHVFIIYDLLRNAIKGWDTARFVRQFPGNSYLLVILIVYKSS